MKNIDWELKNLDSLKEYIFDDLIGEHANTSDINEAINKYAESYHEMKLKLLGIADVVSSTDLKEPTFQEMRKKVLSNKLWHKKDGLYWHFKWGTKTLREAYKTETR